MKTFHGKIIYNPSGKAGEYSYWAANFYNGCSARCEYCYNRKGIVAKVLGGDEPTLKKSLIDFNTAFEIFKKEVKQNLDELQKHGLFFNFVSDPFLPETIDLNVKAMYFCELYDIPVKALTKQVWWLDRFELLGGNTFGIPKNVRVGFTLTGHDELEPGAATNTERIEAMKKLHEAGFKTWGSIEPIVDTLMSMHMISNTVNHCDLYKIGLQSGKKYNRNELIAMFNWVNDMAKTVKIYWKDSFLQQAGIKREDLPSNCVTRDFNL